MRTRKKNAKKQGRKKKKKKLSKELRKLKDGKIKKKHKHHHGKHSKNRKKSSHDKSCKKESKHMKKSKKDKHRKRKHRHSQKESEIVIKRSESMDSPESSNRSRSASPLPSIHTPSPSPTPSPIPSPIPSLSDKLSDPDFYKDKYDKIKERRRQAAKDQTSTVEKRKSGEKFKPIMSVTGREKNQKLRETIEKLKAKNEKYKETLMFNNLFTPSTSADKSTISTENIVEATSPKDSDQFEFVDDSDNESKKNKDAKLQKGAKKVCAVKNENATEALEQAVKDISKWFDEGPKSSPKVIKIDNPSQVVSAEDQDSRVDDDNVSEKSLSFKKELRKRPASRETKVSKRRDIHRTIERLQPGKNKGNLIASASSPRSDEIVPAGPVSKTREAKSVLTTNVDDSSPKLSLGSVLLTVEFKLDKDDPKFSELQEISSPNLRAIQSGEDDPLEELESDQAIEETKPESPEEEKKVEEPNQEVQTAEPTAKFSQEKVTPNLSAWFKAFGAPKSTPSSKTQKKIDESEPEDKTEEKVQEKTLQSPKCVRKYDSPLDEISPSAEGGDSPTPNNASNRQRRTSTGSSVSERSSFSQDLDSPRHQMAHTSPLLRSPASPRTDDFQKITYPIINGTVRAGFYQDTASVKSSPEKSCSPRDGPQSPFSPYSQHVYANNATATPNPYSCPENNKSPLPTYGLNQPPPYYDTSKVPLINKSSRNHDDYTALGPDGLYHKKSENLAKFVDSSPAHSPYAHNSPRSPYLQINSPQTATTPDSPSSSLIIEPKTPMFPAKKRAYTEDTTSVIKMTEGHNLSSNLTEQKQNKDDFQKFNYSLYGTDTISTSVDDIALALSKKSEAHKSNLAKDNSGYTFMDKINIERQENSSIYNGDRHSSQNLSSSDKHNEKTSSVDMINMGYFVSEFEKRSNISEADLMTVSREYQKASMNKGLDIGNIAMNLGMNKMPSQKYNQPAKQAPKASEHPVASNILDFENIQAANQSVSNYGLSDYEINKKIYSGTMSSNSPIDYGNWRNESHVRKTDSVNSSYQSSYSVDNTELNKIKSNLNIPYVTNYSKQVQSPQMQSMPATRPPIIRGTGTLSSELRIPNPRGVANMGDASSSNTNLRRNVDQAQALTVQKLDKPKQAQPLPTSIQYKTPYSSQSPLPLDTLRNIPVSYDDRYLAGFGSSSSIYDKNQMAQMFSKSNPCEAHTSIPTTSIYSQASLNMSKDNASYRTTSSIAQVTQMDKSKSRRKKSEMRQSPISSQSYQTQTSTSDVLSSVKSSLVPGSAFNFGPSGMALSGGLYGESSGFTLEDFRNSTANQLMAANYMAAAAAAHQRNTSDVTVDKLVKPAHQNSTHSGTGAFPFLGHGQTRAAYPFVGTDASSPLYQQYLQRQEEFLGAQIMGLYPPAYHSTGLGVRQPYDSITRPPWL